MRYVSMPGSAGDYISTPDAAAFSALSDFSVLALMSMNDWTPAVEARIATHAGARSWLFLVETGGKLRLDMSNNNTAFQTFAITSVATGIADGSLMWVAALRDRAAGTVKFYTAPYAGGPAIPVIGSFTQLGATFTGAITTALFNGTDVLAVGQDGSGGTNNLVGKMYRLALYTGIYGSGSEALVRDCNPSDAGSGATWVAATTAETWTLNGNTKVLDDATPPPHLPLTAAAMQRKSRR